MRRSVILKEQSADCADYADFSGLICVNLRIKIFFRSTKIGDLTNFQSLALFNLRHVGENLMSKQKPSKRNLETLSIFIVALLVGAVGLVTNNSGFVLAGGIFLLVSIVMFINRKR
jgi:hypothetical protein